MEHKYTLNGKTYIQRELVLGQIQQLSVLLGHVTIPAEIDIASMLQLLGSKAPAAAACVLCDADGRVPWLRLQAGPFPEVIADADVFAAYTLELAGSLTAEMTLKIADDFFDSNPVASVFEALRGIENRIAGAATKAIPSGSTASSAPSAEETSPGGPTSSGPQPSGTASHT